MDAESGQPLFQPRVNPTSAAMARFAEDTRGAAGPVEERLAARAAEYEVRPYPSLRLPLLELCCCCTPCTAVPVPACLTAGLPQERRSRRARRLEAEARRQARVPLSKRSEALGGGCAVLRGGLGAGAGAFLTRPSPLRVQHGQRPRAADQTHRHRSRVHNGHRRSTVVPARHLLLLLRAPHLPWRHPARRRRCRHPQRKRGAPATGHCGRRQRGEGPGKEGAPPPPAGWPGGRVCALALHCPRTAPRARGGPSARRVLAPPSPRHLRRRVFAQGSIVSLACECAAEPRGGV